MVQDHLKQLVLRYNHPSFIERDPIRIPHRFSAREDIEISGFLTALLSWGNRKSILSSADRLMQMMEEEPYQFVMNATPKDLKPLRTFVHRTFNGEDCITFIRALRRCYTEHSGLEDFFTLSKEPGMAERISGFKAAFLKPDDVNLHARKHLPDPLKGSAAKRINMFLRWMVRKDDSGVDFGLWTKISPGELICPLDVHSGRVARKLGLLARRSDDWKAALELTEQLRRFDPADPVKYDFALFGTGADCR